MEVSGDDAPAPPVPAAPAAPAPPAPPDPAWPSAAEPPEPAPAWPPEPASPEPASSPESSSAGRLTPRQVGETLIVKVPGRPLYCSMTALTAETDTWPTAMTKDMAATAAATPTRDSSSSLPIRSCAHASITAPVRPVNTPPSPVKSLIADLPISMRRPAPSGPRRTPPASPLGGG